LFINGHNGHIGKKSVAGYDCLGALLNDSLGDKYYAIGTDAMNTTFNSQKDNGGFEVVEVSNTNDLNGQLANSDENMFYVDFEKVAAEEGWKQILESKQRITTLNVSLSGLQKMMKSAYTTTIIPGETFDGMIVFKEVEPTTLLK
ncbi:MAG: erythromycin esterase family protein, partial [Lachnospiraceae bacterium]|nr:erythromycin esterase family protein [Lachnospiraceae bacterium]